MRMIRIWGCVVLLVISSGSMHADEETDLAFFQASAALDRVMIPALIAVRQGDASIVSPHLDRLIVAWETYQSDQRAMLETASGWDMTRDGINSRLEMAKRFVGTGDVSMARLVLDQLEAELIRLRQSLDRETFVDRLVGFQEIMEAILSEVSTVGKSDPESLKSGMEALMDSWKAIEADGADSDVYGLLWNDASALKDLIRAEGTAISNLAGAVGRPQGEDPVDLADAVRKAFLDVYLFFGE